MTQPSLSPADAKRLVLAIELGQAAQVKKLLEAGSPNVVVPLKHGVKTTPLAVAVKHDQPIIVDLLHAAGATASAEHAAEARSAKVLAKLLDTGVSPNAKDPWNQPLLHSAAKEERLEVVELLLARGADVDATDEKGRTAYQATGSPLIRRLLRAHGSKGLVEQNGRVLEPKRRAGKLSEVEVDDGALGVDASGNVWFSGHVGLQRLAGDTLTVFEFDESFSIDRILPGLGGLVFFSTNWGLLTFDGATFRLLSNENSELHDRHITFLAVDRAGVAHMMGYGGEEKLDRPISRYDGTKMTVLVPGEALPKGLEVNAIAFDAKNQLVFAMPSGVRLADGTVWAPEDNEVDSVVCDGADVWANCSYLGLFRRRAGKEKQWDMPDGISALCLDGKRLWVGTGSGLVKLEGDTVTTIEGLDDEVTALALSKDGTLWGASAGKPFSLRGDELTVLGGGDDDDDEEAQNDDEDEAVELKPVPTTSFVPEAKLPSFVREALARANVAGLPLARFVRPAIGFELGQPVKAAAGGSKFGGTAHLPDGEWPESDSGEPLAFLMQVALSDVAPLDLEGLLPKTGLVSFFCEMVPDELENAAVRFTTKAVSPAELPEMLEVRKSEDDFVAELPELELSFYGTWTLPSAAYLSAYAELSDDDERALATADEALHSKDPKGSSTSRLLGWPVSLQDELVDSPDTLVLLQLDASMKAPKSIGRAFSQWGHGMVHFFISAEDAKAKQFDEVGAVLNFT